MTFFVMIFVTFLKCIESRPRFIMSQLGDKSGNCRHHDISCVRNCPQNCCKMQGPNVEELELRLYSVAYQGTSQCSCLKCLVNSFCLAFYESWSNIIEGIKEMEEATEALDYFGA